MDKDAFKKIMKLSAKTLFTYYTNLLPNVFTDFFLQGVLEHNLLNYGKVGRVNLLIFLLDMYFVWKQSPFAVQLFLLMF